MAIFSNKKTIFITGAGSGLGKGTAIGLARAGHKVIATVETISQVPEFRQYAESEKLDIQVFKLDVNNPLDRAQVEEHDFDIFVSNAAIGHTGPFAEVPVENVRQVFETNFFSAIELAQIAARKFVANKKGKIVFTSSIAGLSVNPFLGPYCASKHALEALAQALQQELENYGVQVATINPGPYKTGFNDMMFEEKEKWYDEKTNFTKRSDLLKGEQMLAQQFDPQDMIDKMVEIIPQDKHDFRTVWPEASEQQVQTYQAELWEKKI